MMTAELTLIIVAKIVSLAVLINSAEYLHSNRHMKDDGLMSWQTGRFRFHWLMTGKRGKIFNFLLSYPAILRLLVLRLILALVIVLSPVAFTLSPVWLVPIVICELIFILRTPYGLDGSDQLIRIVLVTLMIPSIIATERIFTVALLFLVFQVCLSYFTAGVAKLSARGWRDGTFIISVTNLKSYGHPLVGQMMRKNKKIAILSGWLVIIWESGFPLVLVLPYYYAIAILLMGVIFHLSNAIIMGLNCFFWAFISIYPAIFYFLTIRGW